MTDSIPSTEEEMVRATVFVEQAWFDDLKPQLKQQGYALFRAFEEAVNDFVLWYQDNGQDWIPVRVPNHGHKLNSRISVNVRSQVEDICEEKGLYLQGVYYNALYQWCAKNGFVIPDVKKLDILTTFSEEKVKVACYLTDEMIEHLTHARNEREWKLYELMSHACLHFLDWHENKKPDDWYPRALPLKATRFTGDISVDINAPIEALSQEYRLAPKVIIASALHRWALDHGALDRKEDPEDQTTTGFCRVFFPESIARNIRVVIAKRPIIDGVQIQTQSDFSTQAVTRFIEAHQQRPETASYAYRASFDERNSGLASDPMTSFNCVVNRAHHLAMNAISETDNVKLRSVYHNAIIDYLNYLDDVEPTLTL